MAIEPPTKPTPPTTKEDKADAKPSDPEPQKEQKKNPPMNKLQWFVIGLMLGSSGLLILLFIMCGSVTTSSPEKKDTIIVTPRSEPRDDRELESFSNRMDEIERSVLAIRRKP